MIGADLCGNLMDEGIPVNKNIRILVVNNEASVGGDSLISALGSLQLNNVAVINDSGKAFKLYVTENAQDPFDVVMIHDLPNMEEMDLLRGIIEVNAHQYVVILADTLSASKVLDAIKIGASGVLSKPFTADKLRIELEKYSLLREVTKSANQ